MIPFFAKNSRLGYFFNANNLVDKRFIFFEEKDETFIRIKNYKKVNFLILLSPPPKIFLQKILPSRKGRVMSP
jgi:hypothetical protein